MTIAEMQEQLIDADAGFEPQLDGYAASLAALDLIEHWRTCDPDLSLTEQLGDIDLVIGALKKWRQKCATAGRIIGLEKDGK